MKIIRDRANSTTLKKQKPRDNPVNQQGEKDPALKPTDVLDAGILSAAANLKAGEKMTISTSEDVILQIEKSPSPSRFDNFLKTMGSGLGRVAVETKDVIKYDKGLAFKLGALGFKSTDLIGASTAVATAVDSAFLPMVRVIGGILDAHNMVKTMNNPQASAADKVIDVAHVATDALGLAGSVMRFFPAVPAPIGVALEVVGVVGDIGAHGYHMISYLEKKGEACVTKPEPQQIDNQSGVDQALPANNETVVPDPSL